MIVQQRFALSRRDVSTSRVTDALPSVKKRQDKTTEVLCDSSENEMPNEIFLEEKGVGR